MALCHAENLKYSARNFYYGSMHQFYSFRMVKYLYVYNSCTIHWVLWYVSGLEFLSLSTCLYFFILEYVLSTCLSYMLVFIPCWHLGSLLVSKNVVKNYLLYFEANQCWISNIRKNGVFCTTGRLQYENIVSNSWRLPRGLQNFYEGACPTSCLGLLYTPSLPFYKHFLGRTLGRFL